MGRLRTMQLRNEKIVIFLFSFCFLYNQDEYWGSATWNYQKMQTKRPKENLPHPAKEEEKGSLLEE